MRKYKTTTLYQKEQLGFFVALGLLVSVFLLYVYFVSASVVHVVMRQEVNQEVAELSSRISQLEASYIEAQHSVSADIASMHGYTIAEEKIFIERTDTTLVLSQGTDG